METKRDQFFKAKQLGTPKTRSASDLSALIADSENGRGNLSHSAFTARRSQTTGASPLLTDRTGSAKMLDVAAPSPVPFAPTPTPTMDA